MSYLLKNSLFLLLFTFVACTNDEKVKKEQYLIAGEELYALHCSNCHGKNGEGLRDLYPPLNNSDYLNNKNNVICSIKFGLKGPIVVNGKEYNGVMPKNNQLYDLDIAQLTTYIYETWGSTKGLKITETYEVSKVKCSIAD